MDLRDVQVANYFMHRWRNYTSKGRIIKAIYMADLLMIEKHGRRLTSIQFYRHNYGPYDDEVANLVDDGGDAQPDLSLFDRDEMAVIETIGKRWHYRYADHLVAAAKTSPPFIWTRYQRPIDFDRYAQFIQRRKDSMAGTADIAITITPDQSRDQMKEAILAYQ